MLRVTKDKILLAESTPIARNKVPKTRPIRWQVVMSSIKLEEKSILLTSVFTVMLTENGIHINSRLQKVSLIDVKLFKLAIQLLGYDPNKS